MYIWAMKLELSHFIDDDSPPLVIARRKSQPNYKNHTHNFSELVIVFSGNGIHSTGSHSARVGGGDVFVIQGERSHGFSQTENLKLVNVIFDPKYYQFATDEIENMPGYRALFRLEPGMRESPHFDGFLQLNPSNLNRSEVTLLAIEKELEEKGPGYRLQVRALFMQLICHLSRAYQQVKGTNDSLLRIAASLDWIEKYYSTPLGIDELSEKSHMSRRTFTRAFREAMGVSPISYLIDFRIQKGCQLLRTSTKSIAEIGISLGFSDSAHFSRQFKKIKGISPKSYRGSH